MGMKAQSHTVHATYSESKIINCIAPFIHFYLERFSKGHVMIKWTYQVSHELLKNTCPSTNLLLA